ncbi:sensor histidine kinase [Microbacterium sp. Bi121]|uniref:ATP-binding protein n=1 Tax=Microbacterium sp. Bi121 TaxID=2822348 RepID=UPI001DE7DA9A|nr:sensor histidine kinase [Microbacterium sp. Bi121]CAH0152485.1 hypothetical protein SRABI121_01293 [Microbacterium sp. Bi121]
MIGAGDVSEESETDPDSADSAPTDRHELLAARLLTAVNGALAAAAALGVLTVVVQQNPASYPPFFQAIIAAVYALVVVVALLAQVSSRRTIAVLNGVVCSAYLALVALAWPVLALSGAAPSGQLLWLLTVISIPVLAGVIAWGQAGGWIVLGALGAFIPLLRFAMADFSANATANNVQAFATAVLLGALAGGTLARAQRADATAAIARDAAAREAELAARRTVDARAQALVHDEVLATLGFAARATPEMLPVLAFQARRAREALNALASPPTEAVGAAAFRGGLQELARVHGAHFTDASTLDGRATTDVPADVAAAMTGAARQALINTRAHAPDSESNVTLTRIGDGIRVEVSDDGPGFDRDAVAPGRLGIAVSILARLRAVGGRADVRSSPGTGVVVDARWRPAPSTRPVEAAPMGLLGARDMRLAGALLAAGPILLAVYSFTWLRQPIPAVAAGVALAAAFMILSWRAGRAGNAIVVITSALAVAAVCTMFAGVAVPDTATAPTFAGMWPFVGASLVLGMLCFRGRPVAALALLVPITVLMVLSTVPGPYPEARAGAARAVVIVAAAAALAVSVYVLGRHLDRDRASALRASSDRAWLAEVTARAREKVARLDETVGPLLNRIAEGTPLTDAEIRQCLVHEGRLRDGYRAGRLDCPKVADAAARARARGVDVVLIDDVIDREIDGERLERLRSWLVVELDRAVGSFIARILPAGRDALATASSDASSTRFGG